MVLTFPDFILDRWRAVEVVGSRRLTTNPQRIASVIGQAAFAAAAAGAPK